MRFLQLYRQGACGGAAVLAAIVLGAEAHGAEAHGAEAVVFEVDSARTHQTIDNFGASDAWSMQFIEELPQREQEQVARWLFSRGSDAAGQPEGIGLSLWRFNMGAGSAEQEGASQIKPGTRTECFLQADGSYDWSRQAGQRKFLRFAKAYGVPYILGFLNSPPVYFTQNGLATNTGREGASYNLKPEHYGDFARFMAEVIAGLAAHDSVTIDYISPVNEPDGHWNWLGPKQEGTPATKYEVARLTRELDGELTRRGLGTQIIIPESSDFRCMMGEHLAGPERGYEIQSFMSPDSATTYVGDLGHLAPVLAGHSYWTNTPVEYMKECRRTLRDTVAKYGTQLWQTEVCIMGNDREIGGGGGYDRTMKTALYVARLIHHDLVMGDARAWQWWRAMGGDYKDGLLLRQGNEVYDSKLLWSMGNYSRFVRPGAVRLDVRRQGGDGDSATDPWGLMCSAYRNSDGSVVAVVINYADKEAEISLEGLGAGEWKIYRTSDAPGESLRMIGATPTLSGLTIPARSITTLIDK